MFRKDYDIKRDIQSLERELIEVEQLKDLLTIPAWKQIEKIFTDRIQKFIQDVLDLTLKGIDNNKFEITMRRRLAAEFTVLLSAIKSPLIKEQDKRDNLREKTTLLNSLKGDL